MGKNMEYETIIREQLNSMNLENLEELADGSQDSLQIIDTTTVDGIINGLLNGQPMFDSEKILNNILELFLIEIRSAILVACEILIVCIIIGLLNGMSNSFGNKTVSSLGTMICSIVIIALCIGTFYQTYDSCSETIDIMTTTMEVLLPIMIPLLISMGCISSGTIMDPVIIGAVTGFSAIMQHVVIPLVFLSAIFVLINSITEKNYISKLAVFLRKAALFITGLTITIFSGITAIQGIITKSADGVLINTARFSIDNFIPIIGRFAADSLEMVIGCLGLIKSAVGIIGIITIISFIALPIIKILAIAAIYKITAIAAEPITNKNISDSLNEIGTAAITMTVVLASSALMFLVFITTIMAMGGGIWKS